MALFSQRELRTGINRTTQVKKAHEERIRKEVEAAKEKIENIPVDTYTEDYTFIFSSLSNKARLYFQSPEEVKRQLEANPEYQKYMEEKRQYEEAQKYQEAYDRVMRHYEKGMLWAIAAYGEGLERQIAKKLIKKGYAPSESALMKEYEERLKRKQEIQKGAKEFGITPQQFVLLSLKNPNQTFFQGDKPIFENNKLVGIESKTFGKTIPISEYNRIQSVMPRPALYDPSTGAIAKMPSSLAEATDIGAAGKIRIPTAAYLAPNKNEVIEDIEKYMKENKIPKFQTTETSNVTFPSYYSFRGVDWKTKPATLKTEASEFIFGKAVPYYKEKISPVLSNTIFSKIAFSKPSFVSGGLGFGYKGMIDIGIGTESYYKMQGKKYTTITSFLNKGEEKIYSKFGENFGTYAITGTTRILVPETPAGAVGTILGFKVMGKVFSKFPKAAAGLSGYYLGSSIKSYTKATTPEEKKFAAGGIILGTAGLAASAYAWYNKPIKNPKLKLDKTLIINKGLESEKIIRYNSKYGLLGKAKESSFQKFFRPTYKIIKPKITNTYTEKAILYSQDRKAIIFNIRQEKSPTILQKTRGWWEYFGIKPKETIIRKGSTSLVQAILLADEKSFGGVAVEGKVGKYAKVRRLGILRGRQEEVIPVKPDKMQEFLFKKLVGKRKEIAFQVKPEVIDMDWKTRPKIIGTEEFPINMKTALKLQGKQYQYSGGKLSLAVIGKAKGEKITPVPVKRYISDILVRSEEAKTITMKKGGISYTKKLTPEESEKLLYGEIVGKIRGKSGKPIPKGDVQRLAGITKIYEKELPDTSEIFKVEAGEKINADNVVKSLTGMNKQIQQTIPKPQPEKPKLTPELKAGLAEAKLEAIKLIPQTLPRVQIQQKSQNIMAFPISKGISREISAAIEKALPKSKEKIISKSVTKPMEKISLKPISKVIQKPALKPEVKPAQKSALKLALKTALKPALKTAAKSTIISKPIIRLQPEKPFEFSPINLSGKRKILKSKKKISIFRAGYSPSLSASILKISSRKKPTKILDNTYFSGFRPIIKI